MKFLCALFIFSSSWLQGLPLTFPDANQQVEITCSQFLSKMKALAAIPLDERTFDNTILAWDEIGKEFFATAASLKNSQAHRPALAKMEQVFCMALQDDAIITPVVEYLKEALDQDAFSGHEIYYLAAFLDRKPGFEASIDSLNEKIQTKSALQYLFREGDFPYKTAAEEVAILNWNVCFLPGCLPLIFGGVLPWQERVEEVVLKIKECDADVICLQEVFDRKAALKLYEGLKGSYSDFYLSIAPKNLGFSLNSLGLGSGLFVASKYPLKNTYYESFEKCAQPYIERGFFAFDLVTDQKKVHIVTTHMEATLDGFEESVETRQCRFLELKQVIAHLSAHNASSCFMCGDLNIAWGEKEPADSLLQTYFEDAYNCDRKTCTLQDCTYCDLNQLRPSILDYALVYKKGCPLKVKTHTHKVAFEEPLSDHAPQISYCQWP